ncbi:MAG: sel1 repeat family protein [Proteobacteria bacterium]|nr:sel1 repeat family protein [Pseudomonadota bacterium]
MPAVGLNPSTRFVVALASLLLTFLPSTLLAASRLQPRSDKDAGIHRLAQVQRIASRLDVLQMGQHRQLLLDAGIADADLGDNRVVSARVYCCGGPNEEGEAIWAWVPPSIDTVVGDVIEVRMGDPKAKHGTVALINMVLDVRATPGEIPGKCHWDPPDEGKWARNLYCEGIEQEGWVHRGLVYNMWMKPRDDAATETQLAAKAAAPVPVPIASGGGDSLASGAALFAAGDAAGALAAWEPLAQNGNQTAEVLLLTLYSSGAGVTRDMVRAWDLREQLTGHHEAIDYDFALSVWQPRADAGEAAGQYAVGALRMERGQDTSEVGEAVRWLTKAADQSYGVAEWTLGECYAEGTGVKRDEQRAVQLFRRGAEHGSAQAAFSLGAAYEHGRGVRKSDADAVHWYQVAAEGGEGEAALNYANMLDAGRGVPRNSALAAEWYRKGAALGSASAANNLGMSYAMGRGVPRDMVQAYEWFCAAMSRPTRLQNFEQGDANLRRAAGSVSARGRIEANLALARMSAEGQGLPQDDVHAWFWYELVTSSAEFKSSMASTPDGQAVLQAQSRTASRLRPASLTRAQAMARAWAYR